MIKRFVITFAGLFIGLRASHKFQEKYPDKFNLWIEFLILLASGLILDLIGILFFQL